MDTEKPDYVCFDTNILVAEGWPTISQRLSDILGRMEISGIVPLLPVVAQQELANRFVRDYQERRSAIEKSISNLKRISRELVGEVKCHVASEDEVKDRYAARIAQLMKHWKFETVPLDSPPIEELLDLAIKRTAPFEEEGKGFQDVLLFHSLLAFLRQNGKSALLVSKDGGFSAPAVGQQATALGVRFRIGKDLGVVETIIKQYLTGVIKTGWENEGNKLREAVRTRESDLVAFLERNLELSEQDLGFGLLTGSLVAIQGFDVDPDPRALYFQILDVVNKPNEKLVVDMECIVRIRARITSPLQLPPSPRFKLGEGKRSGQASWIDPNLPTQSEQDVVIERVVMVQSAGTPSVSYSDLQFLTASLKTLGWGGWAG